MLKKILHPKFTLIGFALLFGILPLLSIPALDAVVAYEWGENATERERFIATTYEMYWVMSQVTIGLFALMICFLTTGVERAKWTIGYVGAVGAGWFVGAVYANTRFDVFQTEMLAVVGLIFTLVLTSGLLHMNQPE